MKHRESTQSTGIRTSIAAAALVGTILFCGSLTACIAKPPLVQMPPYQVADAEFALARDGIFDAFRSGQQAQEFGWEPLRVEQLEATTVNRNSMTGLPSTQQMNALVAWRQRNGECWVAGFLFSRRYAVESSDWESSFRMLVGYSFPPDRIACDSVGE